MATARKGSWLRRLRRTAGLRSRPRAIVELELDASRRLVKAYRILIIGHVSRIQAEDGCIHGPRSATWIRLENHYFWWAFHALTADHPEEREEARQFAIRLAREEPKWLRACDRAGVFSGNVVTAGDGETIHVREPMV